MRRLCSALLLVLLISQVVTPTPIFDRASMNETERETWDSLKDVVREFLGNYKDPGYKSIVERMPTAFKAQGCNMSLKVQFLHSHVDYFPEILGAYSEEQGERFHQNIREMERRYQGRWDVNMMADYCWMLKRETGNTEKRKRTRRNATIIQNGHRSLSFGETIRDWFRVLKNRIVGKWQEWFSDDSPTPNFSPRDILNIDKTIGSRVQSLSDFFLDLSRVSFDPKRDWGFRVGNWYIIRKVTGEDYGPDSDSDEWDIKPRIPLPSIWKVDCTPNTGGSGIPEATRPPTTTPKIEPTTLQRETTQIITQTESSGLTSVVPTASTTETIVISTEQIPSVTEPAIISTVTSTPEISSESSTVTAEEPIVISNVESTLTSIEPITIFTESTFPSTEIIFTESITTSTEPIQISTEPPTTSTDLILPVLNKRVEDNETVVKRTKKPNNQRGSAEVIMF